MLRFFRQIRQQLIEQQKVRSYLLYALGEILLVVVGILLALQVNNWNESRKQSALEVKVLQEISSDLEADVRSLNNDIRLNEYYIQTIETIQTVLEEQSTYHDSLATYFGRLTFNTTYTLKTGGYRNLQNRGFEIVASDSIRKSITDLYDSAYSFLKESQTTSDRLTYDLFTPEYISYFGRIETDLGFRGSGRVISYTPVDYAGLTDDKAFGLLLDFLAQIKNENLYSIEITLRQLRETKDLVDGYLVELEG